MLPVHLAENIRKQVLFYLQSTFDFRDPAVDKAFEQFLLDPESGLFKGPWVQLRRPFRPASQEETIRFDFKIPFHPFKHQIRSWKRLNSKNHTPEPTIVTTGTGSGKTECFLYPLLDHCLRAKQQGQKGIKAIVLYPMNALATDQEKRFARVIWNTEELKQAGIRVGNYTGRYNPEDPAAPDEDGTKEMGENNGITNHFVQQQDPPDILLTNYRMLDYLLLDPKNQALWQFNEPGVLAYLVLDELHTYDGAQGADVACLIRRLKERLDIGKGTLCFVGTSATLDDRESQKDSVGCKSDGSVDAKETSVDRLARFASTLFEEDIDADAVIGEDRLTVEEIIPPDVEDINLPYPLECEPKQDEDTLCYVIRQAEHWGGPQYKGPTVPPHLLSKDDNRLTNEEKEILEQVELWSIELGEWLKRNKLFKNLLHIFQQSETNKEGPISWNNLVERFAREDFGFNDYPKNEERSSICASFFALVAQAKELRSNVAFPLVPTQVQIWIRELRRLGRLVYEKPIFSWLDEPIREFPALPTFHCSECGESGWVALHDPGEDSRIAALGTEGMQLISDPTKIYREWFGYKGRRSQHIVVFSPSPKEEKKIATKQQAENQDLQWQNQLAFDFKKDFQKQQTLTEVNQESEQLEFDFNHYYICSKSLVLRKGDGPCPLTNDVKRFRVKVNNERRRNENSNEMLGEQGCSNCGSKEGIFFIGSQSATLSSVAIDELFGSVLNNDPKLLAFTDSVQDASHRAGFFTARTYNFTFRTALQHVIDDAGTQGLPLKEAGQRLLQWWSHPKPGWPGHIREAMGSLMPPDLHEYQDYLAYRDSITDGDPPGRLKEQIETRLCWEATSEFGLMLMHGRRLETSGSACLGWDEERIYNTYSRLQDRIPRIDTLLANIAEQDLKLWIYGFLYRARTRGALEHPYIVDFAKRGFWGKYPFGRVLEERETFPPSGNYRPRLMVTQSHQNHDYVLAPTKGNRSPWNIVWARRALKQVNASEASLLDLIHSLLEIGTEERLFKKIHQDGARNYYVIAADAAILYSDQAHLICSKTERSLVRPPLEAMLWEGAPSMEYYADAGTYRVSDCNSRQVYYQNRYRKGALRRVVAHEHTGLLSTEDRERLERTFIHNKHTDDPNVLTCTSTLEMGIDIGDLSSTMLCSIPPNTASYLQRIGRAGRATGTALIVSVVNQRPHDLFFYSRPIEMLRGKVDPPGCWLDASAVLVRQYLAYCFDCATKEGILKDLPRTGKQLIDDLSAGQGHMPQLLEWVTKNETELISHFLKRFQSNIQPDTRTRFIKETTSELLRQRIHQATDEFERTLLDLGNARKRLKDQLSKLDEEERDAKQEIEQELSILQGRSFKFNKTNGLEVLTNAGLLPNYAFPERGVRFYGTIYNNHRGINQDHKSIEITRPAGTALKELAPSNHFYTHSRCFTIQQIAVGNPQRSLMEEWAICGACGHMRRVEELNKPNARPDCPQCGHDHASDSQRDRGQHRRFIEFARSEALSVMEHYESLSGDRSDERQREYYKTFPSFDLTTESASGAVGDDSLPFGIEYRASVTMRELNVGYLADQATIAFGVDKLAPENGFKVCFDCGVVTPPSKSIEAKDHRRSCKARRQFEKRSQEGRQEQVNWNLESIYLYRQLKSEAIRLLLPLADEADINTLIACIILGLRLRFEGNPTYLVVAHQIMPDVATGMRRHYLILLDGVPGGTGYLKTLYQEKDYQNHEGEGIIQVLRLAKNALETCICRQIRQDPDRQDTDGCYKCIRTYHLQYSAGQISRERGILLLARLIDAGEKRVAQKELEAIRPNSLFDSMLEKKFVDTLKDFIQQKKGTWEQTIIRGKQGFRFSLPSSDHLWELELQVPLGPAQGVSIQSLPDFLLRCDNDRIKPIAIFTDGFEFHCHPKNRLADDMQKRRSIIESGKYYVWSITWYDLDAQTQNQPMVYHTQFLPILQKYVIAATKQGKILPDLQLINSNGLEQLKAFITTPFAPGWGQLASLISYFPLRKLVEHRSVNSNDLESAIKQWSIGNPMNSITSCDEGEWVYNDKASLNQDLLTYTTVADAMDSQQNKVIVIARLEDSDTECSSVNYKERWRKFLACINLYQFCEKFYFWTCSEAKNETAPKIPLHAFTEIPEQWQNVLDNVLSSLRPYISDFISSGFTDINFIPDVEYFNENIDDDAFAELAWSKCSPPIAILVGDQLDFTDRWQQQGWNIFTLESLQSSGVKSLIDAIAKSVSGA